MSEPRMRPPEEIEREINRTRADIDRTLTALQLQLSPAALLDRLLRSTRESGGAYVTQLARAARDNPVPVALIGLSLAWLLVADRRRGAIAAPTEPTAKAHASSAASTVTVETPEAPTAQGADARAARGADSEEAAGAAAAAAARLREKRANERSAADESAGIKPRDEPRDTNLRMSRDSKAEVVSKVAQGAGERPSVKTTR